MKHRFRVERKDKEDTDKIKITKEMKSANLRMRELTMTHS